MAKNTSSAPSAVIMTGSELAAEILRDAGARVSRLVARTKAVPTLATVLVGDDPSSATYVRMKIRRCEETGLKSQSYALPKDTTTKALLAKLQQLASDSTVHGILLQHPVPDHIDGRAAFEAIPVEKDVDGVTSATLGRVALGLPSLAPCTPAGIMKLLRHYGVSVPGTRVAVLGRSPILGRPMAYLLTVADATVTLCHSRTRDLPSIVAESELVIAAVGKPRFVPGEWIRPGAVVIDAGYNPGNIGDVDFETASRRASLITPVPGGVGPMTIAVLIEQTVTAAARQLGLDPDTV